MQKITLLTHGCQEANIRVNMVFNFQLLASAVLFIWLLVITFFFFRMNAHYNTLTNGVHKKTLSSLLDEILKKIDFAKQEIDALRSRCDTIEKQSIFHIQKIGLLRYNPFKDTGGEQSFVLSLLDGDDTGVVISGLYSRSGTRWYAKKVVSGKGIDYDLSEEEKKALKQARNN